MNQIPSSSVKSIQEDELEMRLTKNDLQEVFSQRRKW